MLTPLTNQQAEQAVREPSEYEFYAMIHWRKEAAKIIAAYPEKHLDYHAMILRHAHERGWLEALQWACNQVALDGNPKAALDKINQEIRQSVAPDNENLQELIREHPAFREPRKEP